MHSLRYLLALTSFLFVGVSGGYVKRNLTRNGCDTTSESYVRVSTDDCREVVRCSEHGLLTIRCPAGLAFDIERQACDWRVNVPNCDKKEREKRVLPLLDSSKCEPGKLACGNGDCIAKELFCDEQPHCSDGSDENACTPDKDPNAAPLCDPTQCSLPGCFCSDDGTRIPNDMDPASVPQMIMISFDDAVNNNNIPIYRELFKEGRNNPNGCSIKGTFFVSHKYSNYSAIQELHRLGHEIAVHSITHNHDEKYWSEATSDIWAKEMVGTRMIIEKFSNISRNMIIGVRAPHLRLGGNSQFGMMQKEKFLYDSSITAPLSNPPRWPYSLDFRMPHTCYGNGQRCPTRPASVWEVVMNELDRRDDPQYDEQVAGCAMIDSCGITYAEQLYNFLQHNFERHYRTNRAPLGLFMHATWLNRNPEFMDAFTQWVDDILSSNKDVYFVTVTQALQWIQSPRELATLRDFEPWKEKCLVKGFPHCSLPNNCALRTSELPGETIRLQTCAPCPRSYPWLEDPSGNV